MILHFAIRFYFSFTLFTFDRHCLSSFYTVQFCGIMYWGVVCVATQDFILVVFLGTFFLFYYLNRWLMILHVFHSLLCFHNWRDITVPAQSYLVGSPFLLSLIISDSKDRALRINTDCLCVRVCLCACVCVNKILNFYFVSTESTHQIRKAHILFLHLVYNLIAQGCDGLNFQLSSWY